MSDQEGVVARPLVVRNSLPKALPVITVAEDEPDPMAMATIWSPVALLIVPVVRSPEIGDQLPPEPAEVPAGSPPVGERQTRLVPP